MGWLKKTLKGVNKAVNKVGSVASKVVSGAAGVVGKVANSQLGSLIPGAGLVGNLANKAGQIAGTVGNIIKSGQSPRGGSAPAMASPVIEYAPQTAQKLVQGSVSAGNTNVSFSTGKAVQQAQEQVNPKKQSWFAKNKIVVFIGSGVVALIGVLLLVFGKKRGRGRRR